MLQQSYDFKQEVLLVLMYHSPSAELKQGMEITF